jgi:DNA processing protein
MIRAWAFFLALSNIHPRDKKRMRLFVLCVGCPTPTIRLTQHSVTPDVKRFPLAKQGYFSSFLLFRQTALDKSQEFEYAYVNRAENQSCRGRLSVTSRKYWVGFNVVPAIGPAKVRALLDYFGDLETAWQAGAGNLKQAGLDRRAINNLIKMRAQLDLDAEMERLERHQITFLTWEDDQYPSLLRQIYGPPPVLYVRGTLLPDDEWAVAVVGTRKATMYGKQVAQTLSQAIARSRVTVVSGLARGIDTTAHQAALDAGGRTIAVLACGLDRVYPSENRNLARTIIEHGALVSDYPLGTRPDAKNFPPRNRIISGLSLGVVVVEAGIGSGALITVDFAAEQGREVFAVPGNILNRSSRGCNRLIHDGAKMVLGVEDILEELNLTMIEQHTEMRTVLPADATEASLLGLVSDAPLHVDEICRQSRLPIHQVSSTLAMMELKGMVRQVGGMHYILARDGSVPYRID